MKYMLSQIIESALNDNKTLYFSNTFEDEVIHHRSETATFSQRKKELEKAKSFNEVMYIHFIMIYYPNTPYDEISITTNKSDLINNWMKKISESFLKLRRPLRPSLISIDMDHRWHSDIKSKLIRVHKYHPSKQFDWNRIDLLYSSLFAKWDNLIIESKLKNKLPSNEDFLNILKELDKLK